eukprot:3778208-Amphidinium_carterae.1
MLAQTVLPERHGIVFGCSNFLHLRYGDAEECRSSSSSRHKHDTESAHSINEMNIQKNETLSNAKV